MTWLLAILSVCAPAMDNGGWQATEIRCPLEASALLRTAPPDGPTPVTLTPASHASWDAFIFAHPGANPIRLLPGDYRPWGTFRPAWHGGKLVYAGEDADVHPVGRSQHALVDSLDFRGDHDWWVEGITIRAPVGESFTWYDSARITLDRVLIEQSARPYGMRFLAGSDLTLQRSVIRNIAPPSGDRLGVQLRTMLVSGVGRPLVGARILDNEIYDAGDAVGLTVPGADRVTPISDVVIEGNDLYLTSASRTADGLYSLADNGGADIKSRSDTVNYFRGNRIWGVRRSIGASGTQGDAIILQVAAAGWRVEDNVVMDCDSGLKVEVGASDLEARRNLFFGITAHSVAALGAAFDTTAPVILDDNLVVRSDKLCDSDAANWGDTDLYATFPNCGGAGLTSKPWLVPVKVQVRRWTGPAWEVLQ